MTPEGRVKKKVKAALDKLGEECWRFMPVQSGYGAPALDFLLCIRGHFVAIETKAPGKKLTDLQEATAAAIEAAGGIVIVISDDNTLAIALKIILALEFHPNAQGRHANRILNYVSRIGECLRAAKEATGYDGGFSAQQHVVDIYKYKVDFKTEIKRGNAEYLRSVVKSKAPYSATRGHHGAPRTKSKRQP